MIKKITIEGMSCGHCTARIQKALECVPGVAGVDMNLKEKNAVVTLESKVEDDMLKSAVTNAGYEVVAIK